jgi:major membrane immunogen (membrane-anchored lipoprotein)
MIDISQTIRYNGMVLKNILGGPRMKKKILALMLALGLMAGVFTGCTTEEVDAPVDEGNVDTEQDAPEEGNLVDGKYLVKLPVSDHGNYSMGILEVVDGNVSNLDYNEYLANTGEVKNADNYPYAEGIEVIADLNAQYNEKKDMSSVDFDAVSGATTTKETFKEVTEMLIAKAEEGEVYTPVYNDGTYEAKAEEASHGWLAQVTVIVKEGQIVGVNYEEVAVEASEGVEEGDVKSPDNYQYEATFEVVNSMQKLIIDNNGTEDLDVDGITGATNTRTTMLDLVNQALSTAK